MIASFCNHGPASKLSYLGERGESRENANLLSRASRATTFQDIPQMESLLAGYNNGKKKKKTPCICSRFAPSANDTVRSWTQQPKEI